MVSNNGKSLGLQGHLTPSWYKRLCFLYIWEMLGKCSRAEYKKRVGRKDEC